MEGIGVENLSVEVEGFDEKSFGRVALSTSAVSASEKILHPRNFPYFVALKQSVALNKTKEKTLMK